MIWFVVIHLFSTLLDLSRIERPGDHEKDLEILVLRQQLRVAERKLHKPVHASRVKRLTKAMLTIKLRSSGSPAVTQLYEPRSRHQINSVIDTIFRSEGLGIRTPVQAPNANSHAERWIRLARSGRLDKIIFVNGVNARFANKHICAQG